ncbi:sugar diacid utilization regulator [Xanthomonas campestris]|nr:sugar diacid utilization regulator [Xanthomonas campestris]
MLVELQRLHTLLSTPERGNLIAAAALNELVVLKPALDRRGQWNVDEQRRRAHSLLERMRASSPLRIRLALGQYFPQPNGLALSHQIARTTMRIGKARTPDADAFFFDDYRLPVLVDDLRQAWQAEELRKPLQALLTQDRRGQLLQTLSCWFANGMRMAPTAKALGIHRNTLDYRMQRIQDLCAVNLSTTDDCMRLYLALQMRQDSAAAEPEGAQ